MGGFLQIRTGKPPSTFLSVMLGYIICPAGPLYFPVQTPGGFLTIPVWNGKAIQLVRVAKWTNNAKETGSDSSPHEIKVGKANARQQTKTAVFTQNFNFFLVFSLSFWHSRPGRLLCVRRSKTRQPSPRPAATIFLLLNATDRNLWWGFIGVLSIFVFNLIGKRCLYNLPYLEKWIDVSVLDFTKKGGF